ncbi:MAG: hypothetical protein U1F71_03495 [Verrucomicrobiaceae bacterium]
MLAFAGLGDATTNVQTHVQSEVVAMQKELMEGLERSRKEMEATLRATMPEALQSESRPSPLKNIKELNARVYDGRFYAIIAFSSSGILVGLLLFCWPAKAARSLGHGLAESLDPVSATRCLLRLCGMYFVLSTFLSFMAVSLTSILVPLLQLNFTVLLPFGIHFGFGVVILLCDRLLARLFLWRLGSSRP